LARRPGKPRSSSAIAHFVAHMQWQHEALGYGSFVVTLGAAEARKRGLPEGTAVGDAGLAPIAHSGKRGFRAEPVELGYRFATAHHGHGYATEAGRAILDEARRVGLGALIAVTHPENVASQHVLDKLGFARRGRTLAYYDTETELFERSL
jgi:RimJ/RimL family protein N-acetyltransferase